MCLLINQRACSQSAAGADAGHHQHALPLLASGTWLLVFQFLQRRDWRAL